VVLQLARDPGEQLLLGRKAARRQVGHVAELEPAQEAVRRGGVQHLALRRDLLLDRLGAPERSSGADEVRAARCELGQGVLAARRLRARRRPVREDEREELAPVHEQCPGPAIDFDGSGHHGPVPDSASSISVTEEIQVGRRAVRVTHPERVLFPRDGVTKGDLAEYYAAIGDVIVPHLRDRPFTLKRYPHGIEGQPYFHKQAPKGKPEWIPTRRFRTWPREGESRLVDFTLVNETAALVWMVQMNCVDMNAWYSRVDKPERPDYVVFDLDPPESRNGFAQAIQVAHLIREALDELGLRSYPKTSGADGIHVLVPITRRSSYRDTYDLAELVSRGLEAANPGLVTTEWLKKKRRGVLVDHRQNGHGKTIASAYSVRPKPGAPVSTPLRWKELGEKVRPRDFGRREALERVQKHGDLYEPVLRGGQALGPALRRLREEK
jgi:bifunctional non-homologous end joining protein LigD